MSYTSSKAIAGRGSILEYSTTAPSGPFTQLAEIRKASFTGAKYDLVDVSNFQSSNFKEWLPTMADSGDLDFEGNLVPNDPSESDLIAFFNAATLVNWKLVLPAAPAQGFNTTAGSFSFSAYVASVDRDVEVAKAATITGKLKITGAISFAGGS